MTTAELALAIIDCTQEELDDVMDYILNSDIDTEEFNDTLLELGVDVSTWCKRKHPDV